MAKLKIVLGGFIGLYTTGGVTWDYIQYLLGLSMLGHEVYYIEDTMQYSCNQTAGQHWDDSTNTVTYLKTVMEQFGFAGKWAYRDVASNNCYGLTLNQVYEVCSTADVFINVSAATYPRNEYYKIPCRVLIDSDPMFTQVQYWNEGSANDLKEITDIFAFYNFLFTFGENMGATDCAIPTFNLHWHTTRQPICLPYWRSSPVPMQGAFTTVMNWSARSELQYAGQSWGQKEVEFKKYLQLPRRCNNHQFLIMAANGTKEQRNQLLQNNGWLWKDPLQHLQTPALYQGFIRQSLGEFSVAKETYVKSGSGWFSCRSACYLASGRPVITQETGWSKFITKGEGLFSFSNFEEAVAAVEAVAANPALHATKARQLAEGYFDSNVVLANLLSKLH